MARLYLVLITFVFLVLAIFIGAAIPSGLSKSTILILAFIFVPMILFWIISFRSQWVGLTLGSTAVYFSLPLPIIWRMSPAMLWVCLLLAMIILGDCFKVSRKSLSWDWFSLSLVLSGVIVIVRVLVERPGSAELGGSGGGGEAVKIVLAYLAFWVATRIAAQPWDIRQNYRWIVVFSIIGLAVGITTFYTNLAQAEDSAELGVLSQLYSRGTWLLSALCITYFAFQKTRRSDAFTAFLLGSVVLLVFVGLAALTPHRSRPVFVIASFIVTAFAFKKGVSSLFPISLAGFVLLCLAIAVGFDALPSTVQRSLSTVVPIDSRTLNVTEGMSSETGWKSEFRAQMNQLAIDKISDSPFIGAGFGFSASDLNKVLQRAGDQNTGEIQEVAEALALSGNYHNSILQLAVNCGVPAAFLATIGILGLFTKFLNFARRTVSQQTRFASSVIICTAVPVIGQMLMNGGGTDYFNALLLLGMGNGIMQNTHFQGRHEGANGDMVSASTNSLVINRASNFAGSAHFD